jgi:hypothetical protein
MLQGLSRPAMAVLCEDYPKIKSVINANEITDLMNYLLRILNIKVSSKEEQDNLDFQMPVILDFIKSKFGSLTIPEIKEAFKMYVAKEFPEIKVFRILDCVVVGEILNAYLDFRNESLRTYDAKKQLLLATQTEITEIEKQAIRNEFLKLIFEELKARGYSDNLHHLWENNDKMLTSFANKVNATITNFEKKVLYKSEEKLYLKELRNEQMISRRNSAKIAVNDFVRQMNANQKSNIIVNRCRNITASKFLKDYLTDFEKFQKIIEE